MGATPVLAAAAIAAVISVSLAATAVTIPLTRRERMLRILADFGAGRVEDMRPRKPSLTDALRPAVLRFVQLVGDLVSPLPVRQRLSHQLDQAGNPQAWPLDRVIRARMVAMVVLGPLFGLIGYRFSATSGMVLGLALGALVGMLIPGMLIGNVAEKRQKAIRASLPDVLDALVIGVEAGLGLDAALAQVSAMLRGPMPDEINRMLQEMRLGLPRTEALRAMSSRTTVRDLKRLVTALVQAGELGVSVAGILREHASEQRVRRRQAAEEAAQKVAVKLLFPVLFCLFPVIFIVVLGPALINAMTMFTK